MGRGIEVKTRDIDDGDGRQGRKDAWKSKEGGGRKLSMPRERREGKGIDRKERREGGWKREKE